MTDDEVLEEARADGFEVIERMSRRPVGGRLGTRRRRPLPVLPLGTPGGQLGA
jgi:hypothetical protein